mgnify:CR=1 FL=1
MRPTDPPTSSSEPLSDPSILCTEIVGDDVAVVRVVGRGTFLNSVALAQFADHLQSREGDTHKFVVDLTDCPTMDSTFMGTLAKITIRQTQRNNGKLIVCNANEHNRRLLKTLGLSHVMDLRQKAPDEIKGEELKLHAADTHPVTRLERILHMIEAHEKLVDLETENEVRFSNVLKYLRQSLEEEKQAQKESPDGSEPK